MWGRSGKSAENNTETTQTNQCFLCNGCILLDDLTDLETLAGRFWRAGLMFDIPALKFYPKSRCISQVLVFKTGEKLSFLNDDRAIWIWDMVMEIIHHINIFRWVSYLSSSSSSRWRLILKEYEMRAIRLLINSRFIQWVLFIAFIQTSQIQRGCFVNVTLLVHFRSRVCSL